MLRKPNYYLDRLTTILNGDPFTFGKKIPGSSMFPDMIAGTGILTAYVMTPYILYLLWRLKRYGWIIFFLVFVILPLVIGSNFVDTEILKMILMVSPLFFLGIYHILLKIVSREWGEYYWDSDLKSYREKDPNNNSPN